MRNVSDAELDSEPPIRNTDDQNQISEYKEIDMYLNTNQSQLFCALGTSNEDADKGVCVLLHEPKTLQTISSTSGNNLY